jgi:FixJ family two-component response regulator
VTQPHVAIVDDDESVCRSVARLLRHVDMQATTFQSAGDFLASPVRGEFTCLVLDVQLGTGITGLELRQLLLKEGDRTPVIFLTAYDDPQTRAEAARLEGVIIGKGADPLALIEAIRKTQRGHLTLVSRPRAR